MKNKKSLGQHWLKNREILDEIADLAVSDAYEWPVIRDNNEKKPLCVEIGPGLGTLTSSLLKRFDKVVAVEYDNRLATNLPKSFPGKNLEVINTDVLELDFGQFSVPYTVVGNIPYYITSPIIEKVLTVDKLPERVVLLIQKEVAERIVDKHETVLSLFVKNRAKVFTGPKVLASEFTPPPKVDSKVIVLEPIDTPVVNEEVFKVILKAFLAPRKKLVHNLAVFGSREELVSALKRIGVNPDARPGDLHLEQYLALYNAIVAK